MSTVSVIIPTYNRKLQVIEAIDSVLSQTLSDFEILVIDDGSTDGTAEAVKAIDDPRIRYFYKDNGGVSSARNVGLDKASGQYIAFLDSDDLYEPEYLETMVSALEKNPDYDVAYTAAINHFPDGKIEDFRTKYCRSGWISRDIFSCFFVLCQTCVIRHQSSEPLFFDEQLDVSEDVDFLLRLSCRSQFLYVPHAQVIRRVQHNSLSQEDGTVKQTEDFIKVLERFYYELGGDQWIPKRTAHKRLSRLYRKKGLVYHENVARKAAVSMLARAIQLAPFRFRNYRDFLRVFLKFAVTDSMPDWKSLRLLGQPQRNLKTSSEANISIPLGSATELPK